MLTTRSVANPFHFGVRHVMRAQTCISMTRIFNPLAPNSEQHQISPGNIHMLSRKMVMRINQMITKEKML